MEINAFVRMGFGVWYPLSYLHKFVTSYSGTALKEIILAKIFGFHFYGQTFVI